MRFSTVLLGAFAALASAQQTTAASSTPASAPSATTSNSALTSQQAATVECLNRCTKGDVACESKCVPVPNPSADQINKTNECVANCPKGNGTETDNLNYQNCMLGCIGQNYFTTSAGGGGAQPTGGAGAGSGSGSGSGSNNPSGTNAAGGSPTNSGNPASTSKGAAEALRVGSSAVGLLGFMVALLAL